MNWTLRVLVYSFQTNRERRVFLKFCEVKSYIMLLNVEGNIKRFPESKYCDKVQIKKKLKYCYCPKRRRMKTK